MKNSANFAPVQIGQQSVRSRFQLRSMSNGKVDFAEVHSADRLIAINIDGSPAIPEGRVLFSQNLNPRAFDNTHLEVEAALWDMYRLKKIKFIYCPAVATSTAGAIVAAVDPDIQDQNGYAVGQDVSLARFCAHDTAAQTSLYRPKTWTYVPPPDSPFLYTRETFDDNGVPDHWGSPGIFAVLTNNSFASDLGDVGVLWYEATYEFSHRNVEGAIQDFATFTITNDGSSAASTPYPGAAIVYKTGTAPGENINEPEVLNDNCLVFKGLDPAKSYLVRVQFSGGTTCSVAATAVPQSALYGTTIATQGGFSSTVSRATTQFRTNSAGVLRVLVTQGTWVAYPTTSVFFITSLPTVTSVLAP